MPLISRIPSRRRCRGVLQVEINHQQLLMNPHLRSRQPDALGGVHASEHVPSQLAGLLCHLADASGRLTQHLSSKGVNLQRRGVERRLRDQHRVPRLFSRSGQLRKTPGQDHPSVDTAW